MKRAAAGKQRLAVPLIMSVAILGLGVCPTARAFDDWGYLSTVGSPYQTVNVGDMITYWINFEINNGGWDSGGGWVGVGYGANANGSGFTWIGGSWYADNGGNKQIHALLNFRATAAGTIYYCSQGRIWNGDPATYHLNRTWANQPRSVPLSPTAQSYFTVNNLGGVTGVAVSNDAGPEAISMGWTRNGSYYTMVVRRLGAWPDPPTGGTAYTNGQFYGTDNRNRIVYAAGSGTTAVDYDLFANPAGLNSPASNYYYSFYTENYSYYSLATGTVAAGKVNNTNTPAFKPAEGVDSFSYRTGDIGAWNCRGTNWSGPWTWNNGTVTIQSGSLTPAVNYPTAYGNKLRFGPTVNYYHGCYRDLKTAFTTGDFYMAYVYRPGAVGANIWAGMSLFDGSTEKAFVGAYGGSSKAGVQKTGGASAESTYTIQTGGDNTIICKYDFSNKYLYVAGYYQTDTISTTAEPTWGASVDLGAGFVSQISRVLFNAGGWDGGSAGQVDYDEIRIARSWKELLNQIAPVWDGYGANANWDTAANWVGDTVPATTDTVTFGDGFISGATISLNGNRSAKGIIFSDNADQNLTLQNNTLTLSEGGIGISGGSAGSHTIASAVSLSTAQSWTNNTAYDLTVSGALSGAGNLTKMGNTDGRIILSGDNSSYSGAIAINQGRILMTHANALGSVAAGTTVASGPGLQIQGGITTAAEPLTLSGDGYWGGGALDNVSGSNIFAGAVTLGAKTRIRCQAGTLHFTAATAFTGAYDLEPAGGGDIRISGIVGTGAGAIRKIDAGTLYLTGANTYSGATCASGGVVRIANDSSLGTAPGSATPGHLTLDNATLTTTNGSAWTLNANRGIRLGDGGGTINNIGGTITYNGIIAGNGSLTKSGAGGLTLGGANTYTGKTTLTAGTLTISADNNLGAAPAAATAGQLTFNGGTLTISSGFTMSANRGISMTGAGTINVNSSQTLTYGGVITGSGALAKGNAGTLTLTGASTYNGTLTVSSGTLIQNGSNNAAITVSAGTYMRGVGSNGAVTATGEVDPGSAADAIGTMSCSALTLSALGTNRVEISNVAGTAGQQWDLITVGGGSGVITLNATASGNEFVIRLDSNGGTPTGWNNANNYSWKIMDAGSVSGTFAANKFIVNTNDWKADLGGGTFSVSESSGDIYLNFTSGSTPDIALLGTNGASIANNDFVPVFSDGTDFESWHVNGDTHDHIFSLTNNGTLAAGIGNVVSTNAAFTITAQPASPVNASAGTTFTVRFDPAVIGASYVDLYFTNTVSGKSPYTFRVQGTGVWPGLYRSPATFSPSATVGNNPANQAFGVTNVGTGTMGFSVTDDAAWMSLSAATGSVAAGAGQGFTITYDTTGLSAGTYNGTITITAGTASNSPQTIAVTLTMNAIPDPTGQAATGDGKQMVRLAWTKNASYDVMIVHRAGSAPTDPTQGQAYSVGNACGGGTVIYKGTAAHLEHIAGTNNTHYYKFYSINNNHYSPGVAANATLGTYTAGEIYESGSYTNGSALNSLNGPVGWTNAWSASGDGTWTVETNYSDAGADVPAFKTVANYPAISGNRMRINIAAANQGGFAYRYFSPFTSGRIYMAALVSHRWSGSSKYFGLSFYDGATEKAFIGKAGGNTVLAIDSYGSTKVESAYTLNATEGGNTQRFYLIIARYDFSTKEIKTKAYYYTDTVPVNEPGDGTWDATATVPGAGIARIDGLRFGGAGYDSQSLGALWFDEVRVASSWGNLLNVSTPTVTNYNVYGYGNNLVYDGQVTGGQYSITMFMYDSGGVSNADYDVLAPGGTEFIVDNAFSNRVFQNSGQNMIGTSRTVMAYWPGTLGTYTTRVSVVNSNGVWIYNSALASGSSMTFTVNDDDTVAPVYACTTNYIMNGGFENLSTNFDPRPVDWQGVEWGVAGLSADPVRSGNYSLFVRNENSGREQWISSLAASTAYILGADARKVGSPANDILLKVEFWNGTAAAIGSFETNILSTISDSWQRYTLPFTTPAGVSSTKVVLFSWQSGSAGATSFFDNVSLYQGSVEIPPLAARIGATNFYGTPSSTNTVVTIPDGSLYNVGAANPFKLIFRGYDAGSGLSRGTDDNLSQMNVDIGSWLTDNCSAYSAGDSSAYSATLAEGATSVWSWTSVTMDTLWNSGNPNKVTVSIPDADNDRSGDRSWLIDQQYGYIQLVDDDAAPPIPARQNLLDNAALTNAAGGWITYGYGAGCVMGAGEDLGGALYLQERGSGGVYRDAVGANSTRYNLRWRARKESGFDVANMYVKIEFFNAGWSLVGAIETNLNSVLSTAWQTFFLTTTSPASDTVYSRAVFGVWDEGGTGNARAYIDDPCLSAVHPMRVFIGSQEYTAAGGDTTTNAIFYIAGKDLAAVSSGNPLRLVFGAYDEGSGLSRGTTNPDSQMNVDVGSAIANNVAQYLSAESSPYASTYSGGATSVWRWESLSAEELLALTNGVAVTSKVTVTIYDADYDRTTGDRTAIIDQQFGYLVVTSGPPVTSKVIYDGFAASSGSLNGGSGGTGWSGNWSLGGDPYADYVSGSFSSGYSSYFDPTGNKVVFYCDVNGRWVSATRAFDRTFTTGRVFFAFIMNYAQSGANRYAGLKLMDGSTEKAFIGKVSAASDALGVDSSSDNRTSGFNLGSGIGSDYAIAGYYDFSTRLLCASGYRLTSDGNCDMIAEPPYGYWHVETTQTVGHISQLTGARLIAGSTDGGTQIGYVYFDELRVGTNWFEVTRKQGETYYQQQEVGPTIDLVFVGPNYTAGAYDDTITDGELTDVGNKLDLAVRISSPYGVFLTNNNATFNIGSRDGQVCPNWDPLTIGAATNSLGYDSAFQYFYGYNGATVVTCWYQNAFVISNSTVGDTYFVTMSAQNQNSNGGADITAPNGANSVPVSRGITVNSNVQFWVTDDDEEYPEINGSTTYLRFDGRTGSDSSGNRVTDGDMLDGLMVSSRVRDVSSGVWGGASNKLMIFTPTAQISGTWTNCNNPPADGGGQGATFAASGNLAGNHGIDLNAYFVEGTWTARVQISDYDKDRNGDSLTTVSNFPFTVIDDDKVDPTFGSSINSVSNFVATGRPLHVTLNANDLYTSGSTTNRIFTIGDETLNSLCSTSILRFTVGAYDAGSGIARTNTAASTNWYTSLSIGNNALVGNVSNFFPSESSLLGDTTTNGAISVWRFDVPLPPEVISALAAAVTNAIVLNIVDADHDRNGDPLYLRQQLGFLVVTDNDNAPPVPVTYVAMAGGIECPTNAGAGLGGTNVIYRIADGEFTNAANKNLDFSFKVYDVGSGINRGTANPATNMNVTLQNIITNDTSRFAWPPKSSADTKTTTSTSLWTWATAFDQTAISNLYGDINVYNAGVGRTNRVSANIPDADNNRIGDSMWVSNQQFGYFVVYDDDTTAPVIGSLQPGNLLQNSGFELKGNLSAKNWEWDYPDIHGSSWGGTVRTNWGAYEGTWQAAICGTWLPGGLGGSGGWWQEVTNTVGADSVWEGSAMVYNDMNGPPAFQIKIEFYGTNRSSGAQLKALTNNFSDPGTTWTRVSVMATAPVNTVWARLVIFAENGGASGALSIDNAELRCVNNTAMDVVLGRRSLYYQGTGTGAMYRATDADLVSVSPTNMLKLIFGVYDPTSGVHRTYQYERINFDIGSVVQNVCNVYSDRLSSAAAVAPNSSSVFAYVSMPFTVDYDGDGSETGQLVALMQAGTNLVYLSAPNEDYDRGYVDQEWMIDKQYGNLVVIDDDTNGPYTHLIYVGTNFLADGHYTNQVTDGDMISGLFDFSYGLWDESGLWLTNSNAAATNTYGPNGNVNINWDLRNPSGTQIVENRIHPPTNFVSPLGNGSLTATCFEYNVSAVPWADNATGTWNLSISSQDNDRDRGVHSAAIGDAASWDLALSTDFLLPFTVIDDDLVPPAWSNNANGQMLGVVVGATAITKSSGTGTNCVFDVTDGQLAELSGSNLVVNGDFERGFDGWSTWEQVAYDVQSSPLATEMGTNGFIFVDQQYPTPTSGGGVYQTFAASAGVEYELTVRAKRTEHYTAQTLLKIEFFGNDLGVGKQLSIVTNNISYDLSYSWQTFRLSGVAPGGTVWVRPVISFVATNTPTGGTGTWDGYFDNVTFKQTGNGLKLVLNAFDASGITRGTTSPPNQMNVSLGAWSVSNVLNYSSIDSSGSATANTATNVWVWDTFNPLDIGTLYDYGTNRILATIPDADNDRPGDTQVLTNQQFGLLRVLDDDTVGPKSRTIAYAGASAKQLIIASNHTANGVVTTSGSGTNTIYAVSDGYIANLSAGNPLIFAIGALDASSGVARAVAGSTNQNTSFSIGPGVLSGADTMQCYNTNYSSPATAGLVATSVWTFTGSPDLFTDNVVSQLVTVATSWWVYATFVDTDNDRPNDQAATYAQGIGRLTVVDDDTTDPAMSGFRFNGGTTTTDGSLKDNGLTITGVITDASGIYGTSHASKPIFSLSNPTGALGWAVGLAFSDKTVTDGASPAYVGRNNLSIAYNERLTGTWTVAVTAKDADDDGWGAADGKTGTTNINFVVTDDDSAVPNLTDMTFNSSVNPLSGSELFFSEYVEGSGNDKYLEIYNGTGQSINMTNVVIQIFNNGATTPGWSRRLSGTLVHRDVFVVANSLATGWDGTPDDTDVLPYNGDDAIALTYRGATVDVLGVIGSDAMWGSDTTLVRNLSVYLPNKTFTPSEWDGYVNNTFSYLGTHFGPVSDGELVGGTLVLTGKVQDVGSGIVAEGASQPSYNLKQPNGNVIVSGGTFETKPLTNGAAKSTEEPLADPITGINHDNNMLGMHTAIVTVVDYDDDRPNDTLTMTNQLAFLVIDDDTNMPVVAASTWLNLLRNPGFDVPPTSGNYWEGAYGWKAGDPDAHGNYWLNASRERWRSMHGEDNGTWEGAIKGTWGGYTEGGWLQEVTNTTTAGTVWRAGGWFWSDSNWTSTTHELHIHWLNGAGTVIGGKTNYFSAPGTKWTWQENIATSPANCAWVRILIQAWGVGPNGALQFDDMVLGPQQPYPMAVQMNSTNMPVISGTGTNAVYLLSDGDLGSVTPTNPLKLIFSVYDAQSGLSRGTTDASTQGYISVTGWLTNNLANYSDADSSTFADTDMEGAYTGWRFESFSGDQINTLVDSGSNEIRITLFDADDDRFYDRKTNINQRMGWLKVLDDDTNAPVALSFEAKNGEQMTDGDINLGLWSMRMYMEDKESGLATAWSGNQWPPNYSLINPAGHTVHQTVGWTVMNKQSGSNVWELWRAAPAVDSFTNVMTGTYSIVYSAIDMDADRPSDEKRIDHSDYFSNTASKTFVVIDDDQVNPTPPANVTLVPTGWTNVNNFVLSFEPGQDASGIYEYRASTNAAQPTEVTDGFALVSGYSYYNMTGWAISNTSYEVGYDELSLPTWPIYTNAWASLGSWDSYLHYDADPGVMSGGFGTQCVRHILGAGTLGNGESKYTLCGQDVWIHNTNDLKGVISVNAWFKGNLSAVGSGGNKCVAFIKVECFDINSNRLLIVENENNSDHNGQPLNGVNATTWTQVVVTVTNMPANTEFIRFMNGVSGHGSALAVTCFWDNMTATITVAEITGGTFTNALEGNTTNWFFSVDDDNDRPNDRRKSWNTNFVIKLDQTPPAQIAGVMASEGSDPTAEINLNWNALANGGGVNLSPWHTYRIYYTDDGSTPNVTNSPYFCYTNGYPGLTNVSANSAILSNLIFGTTYSLGLVGQDEAGNIGPMSAITNVTLAGFNVTQGMFSVVGGVTNLTLFWHAATNAQNQIIREYDLISVDNSYYSNFYASAYTLRANGWSNRLTDVAPPSPSVMRFYRASGHDQWRNDRATPVASEEVYVAKKIELYPGRNWLALPGVPDSNTMANVFGKNLPAGSSPLDSTRVTWYNRSKTATSTGYVWLCAAPLQWSYTNGVSADNMRVPLQDGCIVEIPTNRPVSTFVFLGRIPTNTSKQWIRCCTNKNFISFGVPAYMHPRDMNLTNSGFKGHASTPIRSDQILKYNKATGATYPYNAWFRLSDQTWRLNDASRTPVPEGFYGPDDALVIITYASTSDWMWTNRLPYTLPTRYLPKSQ